MTGRELSYVLTDIRVRQFGSTKLLGRRPLRRTPNGRAGITFKGDVYPLYSDHTIDPKDESFAIEDCPRCWKGPWPSYADVPDATASGPTLAPRQWYADINDRGPYIAFDGNDTMLAIVEKILTKVAGMGIEKKMRSRCRSGDGRQYDWFIRLRAGASVGLDGSALRDRIGELFEFMDKPVADTRTEPPPSDDEIGDDLAMQQAAKEADRLCEEHGVPEDQRSFVRRFARDLLHMTLDEIGEYWRKSHIVLASAGDDQASNRAEAHVRLELIRRLAQFRWPDPDRPFDGSDGEFDCMNEQGILGLLGYHVGTVNGVPVRERRELLDIVLSNELPNVLPGNDMEAWGRPGTAVRLKKLTNTLNGFLRRAKARRDPSWDQAIFDWTEDLRWLEKTFYKPTFGNVLHLIGTKQRAGGGSSRRSA